MTKTEPADKTDTVYGNHSTNVERKSKSKIRRAYLVTYGTAIVSFVLIFIVGIINGEGSMDPDFEPFFIAGFVGAFVGLIATMFVVRCGNCKTSISSLMRSDGISSERQGKVSLQFSVDPRTALQFMTKKKCPNCGIERL